MTGMRQTSIQLSQPSQKVFPNPVTVLLDKFVDLIASKKEAPRHSVMLCVPQKVRAKVLFVKRSVDKPSLPANFVVDRGVVIGKHTDSKDIVALSAEDIHLCKDAGVRFNMPETLGERTDYFYLQTLVPRTEEFDSDTEE